MKTLSEFMARKNVSFMPIVHDPLPKTKKNGEGYLSVPVFDERQKRVIQIPVWPNHFEYFEEILQDIENGKEALLPCYYDHINGRFCFSWKDTKKCLEEGQKFKAKPAPPQKNKPARSYAGMPTPKSEFDYKHPPVEIQQGGLFDLVNEDELKENSNNKIDNNSSFGCRETRAQILTLIFVYSQTKDCDGEKWVELSINSMTESLGCKRHMIERGLNFLVESKFIEKKVDQGKTASYKPLIQWHDLFKLVAKWTNSKG